MKGVDKTISSYILLILFLFTQLVVRKGTINEQHCYEMQLCNIENDYLPKSFKSIYLVLFYFFIYKMKK